MRLSLFVWGSLCLFCLLMSSSVLLFRLKVVGLRLVMISGMFLWWCLVLVCLVSFLFLVVKLI